MMRRGKWLLAGGVATVFFLVCCLTVSDYGISWDEPAHFFRGQAQVDLLLTGDFDYKDLVTRWRKSIYQDPSQPARFFFQDSGHPPINGTLAALLNRLLYQDLGVMGDIESYHLFNILCGTFLVGVVTMFAAETYGIFAGMVAGLVMASYPLFFAESHFNVKDPAEAAFFGATIWCFWKSTKDFSWKWLLGAVLFCSLALGVKFNILFLPFILGPWFILRFGKGLARPLEFLGKIPKKYLLVAILAPVIIGGIFVGSWVYLWQDPIRNTLNVVRYYRDIGTGGMGQPAFILPGGFNAFPVAWILLTTPPWVILLTIVGLLAALMSFCEKEKTGWLWMLWLVVPIARVSWPNSSIYGGVRQIMEFIPAMALVAGLGGERIVGILARGFSLLRGRERVLKGVLLLGFLPQFLILYQLHPNENVYFNFLIGGLRGAKAANIPYWGNSFGNAYYQAVGWLNKNAAEGSRLALVQGTATNVPTLYIDPKIKYGNNLWSGMDREGEYLLELTHQGGEMAYFDVWYYVNNILEPVHEVKVDGVAIAKIWKNDEEHARAEYRKEKNLPVVVSRKGSSITIAVGEETALARLLMTFALTGECKPITSGMVEISVDGENWRMMDEKIGDYQVTSYPSLEDNLVRFALYGRKGKYVRVTWVGEEGCRMGRVEAGLTGFGS